ncbi:hypothetical protein [Marinagarivorans algicola]|uniref:hypothetical protein n=1 Tax=Marinagarivorans algicola TaxID=1513270 RepID=UPI0006B4C479|nr:hypothetical protein [Marinagarivorans algicola]
MATIINLHPTLLGEPAHLGYLEQNLKRPTVIKRGQAVIDLNDQPSNTPRQRIEPVAHMINFYQPFNTTPPTAA